MKPSRLELRGHHIAHFAEDYFGSTKDFYLGPEGYMGITKRINLKNLKSKPLPRADITSIFYGLEFKLHLNRTWRLLRTEEDLEVGIVNGLDSICEKCLIFDSRECLDNNMDNLALKAYGLNVGEIYQAKELFHKIVEFSKKTGIRSPRDVWESFLLEQIKELYK